ncbi:MAG TPA: hypothetical protein VM779_03700 [Thermoanaerobaculia bacterium]|nr:hypothetical protein [Thermoanaerobaculia bacterium]
MKHLALATAGFAVVLFFSMPASPWEFDEPLFFQGLHRYDPLSHHPPPPGYPVFMGVGKFVRMVAPSDFAALRAISIAGSLIGFVMLALAFRNMSGEMAAGIAGALLFYFSPSMLVHATLPISEPGALALLAAALYLGTRTSSPASFAAIAALAVGWRMQFAIFVVPLLLVRVAMMRRWRDRGTALLAFTFVCLAWLIPLAAAVGGIEELAEFETGQGRYLAEHDAGQSRGGWTPAMIALRFVAHPWGVKVASAPLLLAAAIGFVMAVRRRHWLALPMTLAGAVYVAFALRVMDPADGARYAIPFVLVTAFFAAVGVAFLSSRFSIPPLALPLLFCAGSLVYVSSLLYQRSRSASPPVQAAEHARRVYPPNAVAVYELPLWPHATYYLRDHQPMRLDDALRRFHDRPDVPLFLYADGASRERGAATFAWAASDAYSKLTRNHYRVASIAPIPPESRYRPVRGIYGPEREPEGLAWRWLAPLAELQLPRGEARIVTIHSGLPADSLIEANELTVEADGAPRGTHRVERGGVTAIEIPVPPGAPLLVLRSARSFVPAEVPGSLSRDPRRLAVKLYGLATRAAAAPAEPPAASPR